MTCYEIEKTLMESLLLNCVVARDDISLLELVPLAQDAKSEASERAVYTPVFKENILRAAVGGCVFVKNAAQYAKSVRVFSIVARKIVAPEWDSGGVISQQDGNLLDMARQLLASKKFKFAAGALDTPEYLLARMISQEPVRGRGFPTASVSAGAQTMECGG